MAFKLQAMTLNKNELIDYFYTNRKLFYKYITKFGLDPDDVIHDCCLKLLESKTNIIIISKGDKLNYLYGFIKNNCISSHKKEKRYTELNGYDIMEEEKEVSELQDIVNRSRLSEFKKKVIIGHFGRDLTYKTLGEELHINVATLKSAFHRSKDELKLLLQ
jgi:RNA polymerase sigma factor (sigma-70 family)